MPPLWTVVKAARAQPGCRRSGEAQISSAHSLRKIRGPEGERPPRRPRRSACGGSVATGAAGRRASMVASSVPGPLSDGPAGSGVAGVGTEEPQPHDWAARSVDGRTGQLQESGPQQHPSAVALDGQATASLAGPIPTTAARTRRTTMRRTNPILTRNPGSRPRIPGPRNSYRSGRLTTLRSTTPAEKADAVRTPSCRRRRRRSPERAASRGRRQ